MMVKVRYNRPGNDSREWQQRLLAETEDMIVSSFVFRLQKPLSSEDGDDVLIESGYYGVLFDLWDRWYNVIKIYNEDKEFIGYYTDIRKPPVITEDGIEALDLFLDVWVYLDGSYLILDREEFQEAEIADHLRDRAEETVKMVEKMIRDNEYPPELVKQYDVRPEDLKDLQ